VPARKNTPFLDDRWRQKIQAAAMLINRLNDHAAGRNEMTATQVRAAEILLKKVLPDLAAVEHNGEASVRYTISAEPMTAEQWKREVEQEYLPPLLENAKKAIVS
jgi:hypothetical protein